MSQLFSIGHSTDTIQVFIDYLINQKIETLIDVRSVPYSRFAKQFNKEHLSNFLKYNKIYYIQMGDTLGARHQEDDLLFEDGKVNFYKVMDTDRFKGGIARIEKGLKKGYKIALMCSEKNPIECHRFSLVSNYLDKKGHEIDHIIGNEVYNHKFLVQKLIDYYNEYSKITTDINKILKYQFLQDTLFNLGKIDKKKLFMDLNQIVAYNSVEENVEIV